MSVVDIHGNPFIPTAAPYDPYVDHLEERIADLEFSLEDQGWNQLGGESQTEFSRAALQKIVARSRSYFLVNPIVRRAANLSRYYTFGQGINVQAIHPAVDEVVQSFWHDPKNVAELTTLQAMGQKDTQLMTDGNLFFVLFTNQYTGRVRIRSIVVEEIEQIICDPEDDRTPWFYKRVYTKKNFDYSTGQEDHKTRTAYYPDWLYRPEPADRVDAINGNPVMWDSPIYHVAVGHMPWMRFGIPEIYPALDWSKGYKESIEDDATRSKALSMFAWKMSVKGGPTRVAAAKSKLATTYAPATGGQETNPKPTVGSAAITTPGQSLEPYNVSGSTLRADHNRALRQFAVTALDLPETFFGDADVGNHATAKTLDRPTELKYAERQSLWNNILTRILEYVVEADATAPLGMLQGNLIYDDYDDEVWKLELETDPETGNPLDQRIDIDFPMIVERDMAQHMDAIIKFATLDGKSLSGTVDMSTLRQMFLRALREDDIDMVLEHINQLLPAEDSDASEVETRLAQEVAKLSEAVRDVRR